MLHKGYLKKKEVNSEFAMTICKYLLLAVQMQSFARHVCVCVWEREREGPYDPTP